MGLPVLISRSRRLAQTPPAYVSREQQKNGARWEIRLMRITKHEKSYIVELSDHSAWRIWPADMADTLQWLPTTEIKIRKIDDETCSHVLINQSDGSRVRVIEAYRIWRVDEVHRSLSC
jgi:hypothetical protein